jgi:hypothetical protein
MQQARLDELHIRIDLRECIVARIRSIESRVQMLVRGPLRKVRDLEDLDVDIDLRAQLIADAREGGLADVQYPDEDRRADGGVDGREIGHVLLRSRTPFVDPANP